MIILNSKVRLHYTIPFSELYLKHNKFLVQQFFFELHQI